MQTLTLDFETYYDADYTLSKLTIEEYVRDERFDAYMVGLKVADTNPGCLKKPLDVTMHKIPWHKTAVIAHNAQFDGFILFDRFQARPAFWFDTLSMARLLFPHEKSHSLLKLAEKFNIGVKDKTALVNMKGVKNPTPEQLNATAAYCAQDVELTYKLFRMMLPLVPKEELRLIDLTVRLFTEPVVELDTKLLAKYHREVVENKDRLLEEIGATRELLHSASSYSELLRHLGVEPPTKISPRTGKTTFAFAKTDEQHKQLLDHSDPRVQALVAARLGIKSTGDETRAERLYHTGKRGPAPVPLKYCGAHTTRWSGDGKVNWQNFRRGSTIRRAVRAPQGYAVVVGDLAQIECRMLNWFAGEEEVLNAFREKRDLYSEAATRFYGRPISKADKLERHLGKTIELGCGYGMGGTKFQATCKAGALGGPSIILEEYEADAAVKSYRSSHPGVVNLWSHAGKVIIPTLINRENLSWGPLTISNGYVYLPNGAPLDYTTVSAVQGEKRNEYVQIRKGQPKRIYGPLIVENVIQALSRLVMAQAMLTIAERYRIVTCTHDEVVALAPVSEAEDALEFLLATLRKEPIWAPGIPLDAEGSQGERYDK